MTNATTILKRNGLSVTSGRIQILDLFAQAEGALAHSDVEKNTDDNFDRVTVYRTLQTFVDKGIIHQVPTMDNSILYALCKHDCHPGTHYDNHVHFICTQCNKTVCLDDVTVPAVKLPEGFKPAAAAMIVRGICIDCAQPTH